MYFCPACGSPVSKYETFCFKCGRQIPKDLHDRVKKQKFYKKKSFLIPMATFLSLLIVTVAFYSVLQYKSTKAKQYYDKGETYLLEEDYVQAKEAFNKARKSKDSFEQAHIAYAFVKEALAIERTIEQANDQLSQEDFTEAINILSEADQQLKSYYGEAVNLLLEQVNNEQQHVKVQKLKTSLDEEPSIDDLKLLLWDAEGINTAEAAEISNDIKSQIIEYVYSHASELLNKKQFSEAENLVNDGLRYIPDSEKMQSLKITINKEKSAFETAQQERIEKAVSVATKEHQQNKQDAITLERATVKKGNKDKVIVTGEVVSKATIPVNSVLVEYKIMNDKKNEIASNKVFVFPEKLLPDETGKFEFTHYDLDKVKGDLKIEVEKIT